MWLSPSTPARCLRLRQGLVEVLCSNLNLQQPVSSYGTSRKSVLDKSFNQEQVTFTAPFSDDPLVAVIGGGISGLICANFLDKRGVRSTVFDATRMVNVVRPFWVSKLEPYNGMWHMSENGKPCGKLDAIVIACNVATALLANGKMWKWLVNDIRITFDCKTNERICILEPEGLARGSRDWEQTYAEVDRRLDCAERQLRIMQQIDRDRTLTQLANARLDLAVGGLKIHEAHLISSICPRYQSTSLLLNEKAVCCMHMGNFDEAETLLVEALNKDARDPETLANLVVCCLHLGKPSSKSFSQLKLSHPDHVLVKRVTAAEESFDRALQSFS